MANPKITGFIIALVLVSFFAGVSGIYLSEISNNYNGTYSDQLNDYNELNSIKSDVDTIEENTNIQQESGVIDIIGGYFSAGYNALKLTANSFNIFDRMKNEAIQDAQLGEVGGMINVTIVTIVLVLIIIGIIIASVVKRDL